MIISLFTLLFDLVIGLFFVKKGVAYGGTMGNFVNKESWLGMAQLRYVEELAWWNGVVSRREVVERFGVSAQQGSAIIQTYLELNPKAMHYCLKRRRYLVTAKMKRYFTEPDEAELRAELMKDDGGFSCVSLPMVEVDARVHRYVMVALRQRRIALVKYQSRSQPEAKWREIAPHAVGDDGGRLHVRAWCFKNEDYRDFSLLRIQEIKWPESGAPMDLPEDEAWEEMVGLEFKISSELDEGTRQALVEDYGLEDENGKIFIKCRRAMRPYVMHRMGLHADSGLPLGRFFVSDDIT